MQIARYKNEWSLKKAIFKLFLKIYKLPNAFLSVSN